MLTNSCFGIPDYLRISVTDRCNLRCVYCLPQNGIICKPREEILTFEEILRLAKIFATLGIKKIRLTGGEPLVRREIINLAESITKINGLESVSLTTNGTLLCFFARALKQAGIKSINISLDTLNRDKFRRITRNDSFYKVLAGIDKAKEIGFSPLKLNMVVLRGINDEEIIDFVNFSCSRGLILRFIEFTAVTPLWSQDYFTPIEDVKKICENRFKLGKIAYASPGPAVYYRTEQGGILGFIKTDEYNCKHCSRLRLSATGELKLCLYETQGFCLKYLLRSGASDLEIEEQIKQRISMKRDVNYRSCQSSKLYMSSIGG